MFSPNSFFGEGSWTFKTTQKGVTLEGEVIAPSEEKIAVVQYTDTDDSSLWCYNSKLAELRLRITDPKRNLDKSFVAKETAAFEIVDRQSPKGGITL
jgi:hypothetical protein